MKQLSSCTAVVVGAAFVMCAATCAADRQGLGPVSFVVSSSADPAPPPQHALALLDAIVRGDDNAATTDFDPTMHSGLTPDKLGSAWHDYQQLFGQYQSHGDPQQVARGDLTVVSVPLQMEKEPGEFRVTFQPDGTVVGLWFLKAGVPVP